jgi:RNA polymerase sigma factor (TIGR02999 family)
MEEQRPSVEQWFSLAYDELRRLAASVRGRESQETLSPTALVHEAYVRLASLHQVAPESRLHFMMTAARAMRRVLVDAARQRNAAKRDAGGFFVTLDDAEDTGAIRSEMVLALDAALEELSRRDPRASEVIVYRYFGGFSVTETAEALQVSESTIHREWQFARAWLGDELRRAG